MSVAPNNWNIPVPEPPPPPPWILISTWLVNGEFVILAIPSPKKFRVWTPLLIKVLPLSIVTPVNPGTFCKSMLCVTLLLAKKNWRSVPDRELE